MQRSLQSFAGLVLLGVLLLFLNGVGSIFLSRFYIDLTEEGLYTLSPGTKNILGSLKEPIVIKAYMSKTDTTKYPAVKLYGDRVISLLKEYERTGSGHITLEMYDPRPDTDEESWAQKFGITPLAMPGGEKIFFGLAAVNSRGDEEVLPVFSLARQEYLEYDITRLLYSLSLTNKPVIGIISALDMNGAGNLPPELMTGRPSGQEPWVVVSQLQKFAEVRFLKPDAGRIDPAIKVLMLIHPKNLTQQTLYAIDQFVMRGGNLFVALDPYCNAERPDPSQMQNPQAAMMLERSSNLKELLSGWGVELVEKKMVGDINLATKVNTQQSNEPEDFVFWMTLDGHSEFGTQTINKQDILTSQLDNVLLPWAGALKKLDVQGVTFEPLFQTTPQAMLYEEGDYRMGGGTPDSLLSKYIKGSESLVLAARLHGKFKSNFQAKPEGAEGQEPPLKESVGESHIVVIGDADFLSDQASVVAQNFLGTKMVSLINDNLSFAGNLAENLLGSSDLISLRSRGQYTRPFTKVKEIEKNAEEKWRLEEMSLQATLNAANQRLNQLQSGAEKGGDGQQVINKALLDEVKKFREQRAEAQLRLRDVRRNLRQDKERLGTWLFLLNTFFVPLALIVGVLLWNQRGRQKDLASANE